MADRCRQRRAGIWRRSRGEDGQSAVEFALVLPLLLILITGIFQFGIMFNKYITLNDAVRSGAQTLALGRGLSNPCDPAVTQTVNSAVDTGLTAGQVTTTITTGTDTCGTGSYPSRTGGSEAQGDPATVSVSYPYTLSVFGFGILSLNLSASASDAVE